MDSTSDPQGGTNKRNNIRRDIGHETALARVQLEICFRNHYGELTQLLRPHIVRMGLAANRWDAERIAMETLSDTYLEIQSHLHDYLISRSAKTWIVGYALNLLRRRRREDFRRSGREVPLDSVIPAALAGEVAGAIKEELGDRFIFRLLLQGAASGFSEPEQVLAQQQAADDLATLLRELYQIIPTLDSLDQDVLYAALQMNFDSAAMARHLGIRPGAARTRLHRAIRRLSHAYFREHPPRDFK